MCSRMILCVVLGFMTLARSHGSDEFVSVVMEKLKSFYNNLPQTSACYITNFDHTSPVQCVTYCLARRDLCKGVVYNRENGSCKLLYCDPEKNFTSGQNESGNWELFWKINVCKEGWVKHENYCYLLNQTGDTWMNAKAVCEDNGGSLTSIRSFEENSWIVSTLLPPWEEALCSPLWWACCTYWTGGNDFGAEGNFTWISDNTTLDFVNWHPGEPDNKNGQECLSICRDEYWADCNCRNNWPYICKAPAM